MENNNNVSRRDFIKASAAASATATLMAAGNYAYAAPAGKIKVGLIGCGGRGTGAAENILSASTDVEIWSMGDAMPDRLNGSRGRIKEVGKDRYKVTDDRAFSGLDAYQKVIASGVDLVILATPPGFRPQHLRAAVEAGKHIFCEKPVAVDAPGIRMNLETYEMAKKKNLGIVAGTQRRHQTNYLETIKRIQDGAIGKITSGQCYWNQGALWHRPREAGWSDLEYHIRNWIYFTYMSGDHLVEQHVHNIDVMNWVNNAHPTKCVGLGGRQVRTGEDFGHIFDHFAIEFWYPGDVHVTSMCRQQDNTAGNVSERIVGTKGSSNCAGRISGENPFRFDGKYRNPYEQEHVDLIESIQKNEPLNELKQVSESVLTSIMGRMSCYTGQEITWEMALNSTESLMPANMSMDMKITVPPVAMPGKTKFI